MKAITGVIVFSVILIVLLLFVFYPFGFWTKVEARSSECYMVEYSKNKVIWHDYMFFDNLLTADLVAKNLTYAQVNKKSEVVQDSIYNNSGK